MSLCVRSPKVVKDHCSAVKWGSSPQVAAWAFGKTNFRHILASMNIARPGWEIVEYGNSMTKMH